MTSSSVRADSICESRSRSSIVLTARCASATIRWSTRCTTSRSGLAVDGIGEHRQRPDGGLQLVGDVRDEVGAHRVGAHPLAHVLGGDHRAAGGERLGLDRQPRASAGRGARRAASCARRGRPPPDWTRCAPPRAPRCASPAGSSPSRCGTRSSPSGHRRRHRCRGAPGHRATGRRPRRRRGPGPGAPVRATAPAGSGVGVGAVSAGRIRRGASAPRRRPMPNPTAPPMPMPTTRASTRPITVAPSLWDATTAPRWADRCRSRRRAASGPSRSTMYCVRSPMFTA